MLFFFATVADLGVRHDFVSHAEDAKSAKGWRVWTIVCWPETDAAMDTLIADPADAPNPARASRFQAGRQWRGVGNPCR